MVEAATRGGIGAASPAATAIVSARSRPDRGLAVPVIIRLRRRLLYRADALYSYHIGRDEVDNRRWSIYFRTVVLTRFDERAYMVLS